MGGKVFRFSKETAAKYPDSRLHKVIIGEESTLTLENGVCFFDRNPVYFEQVLD